MREEELAIALDTAISSGAFSDLASPTPEYWSLMGLLERLLPGIAGAPISGIDLIRVEVASIHSPTELEILGLALLLDSGLFVPTWMRFLLDEETKTLQFAAAALEAVLPPSRDPLSASYGSSDADKLARLISESAPDLAWIHQDHWPAGGSLPAHWSPGGDPPPKVLHFYSVSDLYGELSNFAPYPIIVDGQTWPTSEHYFQAQKFPSKKDQARVRGARTPMEAARLGRSRKIPIRKDWDSYRLTAMRTALDAKFTQHSVLADLLLSTGDSKLVEHTSNDSYWGDGGDGSGANWLGILLMEVRDRLMKAAED